MTSTPNEDSSDEDLLDCVDDALRNGSNMTRANLAFDFLCERYGHKRRLLPQYVKDMARLEAMDAYIWKGSS